MAISPSGATVWRDYSTDGVPASGAHKVQKSQVRAWSDAVETRLDAVSTAAKLYETRAALYADITEDANTLAWVVSDGTAAYNGIYMKVGASGSGSWSRVGDLPYSFIVATDVGDGTANAIQAASLIPVSESALVILNIFEENTGSPVTVAFNGGAALTVKTNTGNDVAPGGLAAGMRILGVVSGSTFRLVSDQVSSAIVAAAEAAQTAAEGARDAALSAVPAAYPASLAALKALDTSTTSAAYLKQSGREGTFIWRAGDYSTLVAADTQEGIYVKADAIAATSGAWVRVTGPDLSLNVKWFGASTSASAADNTLAIQAAVDLCSLSGGGIVFIPSGTYDVQPGLTVTSSVGVTLMGAGRRSTVLQPSSLTGDFIVLSGWNSTIRDVCILSSTRRTGGSTITLSGAHTRAEDCVLSGQYIGVYMTGVAAQIVGLSIQATASGGIGIDVAGGDTSQIIHRTLIGAQDAPYPTAGIRIKNSSALRISDSDVLTAGKALLIDPGNGEGVYSLKVVNCHFDTSEYGLEILPSGTGIVARLDFSNCWFGGNSAAGVYIYNTGSGVCQGFDFHGCNVHGNASSGYSFRNCSGLNIIGGRVGNNAWGIYFEGSVTDWSVVGVQIGAGDGASGNANWGIRVDPTSERYIISSSRIVGNLSGGVTGHTASATKVLANNVGA